MNIIDSNTLLIAFDRSKDN